MNSAAKPVAAETPEIPTLKGRPLVGSLLEFRNRRLQLMQKSRRLRRFVALQDGSRSPSSWPARRSVAAHAVLVEQQDKFIKSRGLRVIGRPLLGRGLLSSEHDFHKRQRKLMAPAFAAKRIAGYAGAMAACTESAQAGFGERVDLSEEMMKLTLAIVGKTLFGADVLGEAGEIGEALTVALRYLPDELSRVPLPYAVPTPAHLRMRRAVKRLDATVYRMIDERRGTREDRGDVLSMLLLAQDEDDGSVMTPVQVRDEVMTLFLACHETTANALAWTTFYPCRGIPTSTPAVRDEAREVLQGRLPTVEDLPRMPYGLMVLKEAMRLYPPAYLMGRTAEADVQLGPHPLKKGSVVMVNIFGIQRRADYFPDPERFSPERFAPAAEKQLHRGSYLPFGGGPRVCIGNHFATMEGHLLLSHLAQRLVFHYDGPPVEPEPLVTLRPKGGLPVRVTRL